MIRRLSFLAFSLVPLTCSWAGDEASPGGARQALNRAGELAKVLGSDDPVDAKNAIKEAVRMLSSMEAMSALLNSAVEKIAAIRAEFEKKAARGTSTAAIAFYEAELKMMKGREADLSDLRGKLTGAVAQLKEKIDKAKADPDVQALLKDDELLRWAKETSEKLKGYKLPSVDP
jgi:hypothetical protein